MNDSTDLQYFRLAWIEDPHTLWWGVRTATMVWPADHSWLAIQFQQFPRVTLSVHSLFRNLDPTFQQRVRFEMILFESQELDDMLTQILFLREYFNETNSPLMWCF